MLLSSCTSRYVMRSILAGRNVVRDALAEGRCQGLRRSLSLGDQRRYSSKTVGSSEREDSAFCLPWIGSADVGRCPPHFSALA